MADGQLDQARTQDVPATERPASRRGFLTGLGRLAIGACAAGAAFDPSSVLAATVGASRRTLSLVSLHTNEKLKVTYWADGRYVPTALADANELLRDWRSGEIGKIDPKLLDLLFALRTKLHTDEPFQVISGYRSPKTNAMLAGRTRHSGVADKSLHMQGKAIDIDLAGRQLNRIRQAATELKLGGVGYYPKSSFVHVDTGRVRYWS
ncbi:MAG TPA: DUF882 domain-containing protein [Azospirillaceae bacterium]|nr:DUF882 domain-containing protein [Azospirillaceae bacterium]